MADMNKLNYATEYSNVLANAFPYTLYFGALYGTPNNGRYKITGAKTIEIPTIRTTGRVNADRDSITVAKRNYDNAWETKVLENERKWSTLVHPMDVDQTNYVTTISNITQTFNETQKFPEMDCYTISKIFSDWSKVTGDDGKVHKADETELTVDTVLEVFDKMMLNMDNARVPANGRILYVTNEVKTLLKNANKIERTLNVESAASNINRVVNRLDEVEIIGVPSSLMKTKYDFTEGAKVAGGAKQINMFLVNPLAVITPVSYTFAQLDAPSAGSEGKWVYYEESFEDVFILNKQSDAIQFNVSATGASE